VTAVVVVDVLGVVADVDEVEEQPTNREAIIIITEMTNINFFIYFLFILSVIIFKTSIVFNNTSFVYPPELK
jgi:hypothetical protein